MVSTASPVVSPEHDQLIASSCIMTTLLTLLTCTVPTAKRAKRAKRARIRRLLRKEKLKLSWYICSFRSVSSPRLSCSAQPQNCVGHSHPPVLSRISQECPPKHRRWACAFERRLAAAGEGGGSGKAKTNFLCPLVVHGVTRQSGVLLKHLRGTRYAASSKPHCSASTHQALVLLCILQ